VSKSTVYKTGAKRSADVNGFRYDLVPAEGIEAAAKAMHEGACRHGDNNWKKGLKHSVYINHTLRHINLYMQGHRGEDHIGHALANLMMLIWNEKNLPEFNDLSGLGYVPFDDTAVLVPPPKRPVGRPRKSAPTITEANGNE